MSSIVWVAVVVVVGVALVAASANATASVSEGKRFVKWMVLVFAAFLALAAIPILAGG